jgi:hypothetical protein
MVILQALVMAVMLAVSIGATVHAQKRNDPNLSGKNPPPPQYMPGGRWVDPSYRGSTVNPSFKTYGEKGCPDGYYYTGTTCHSSRISPPSSSGGSVK